MAGGLCGRILDAISASRAPEVSAHLRGSCRKEDGQLNELPQGFLLCGYIRMEITADSLVMKAEVAFLQTGFALQFTLR